MSATATMLTSTDWPVQLFPHQVQAVQWMQRTEQRPRMVPEQPHGGILAHAMGLGKTITMLSLVRLQGIGSTVVVCPKSVLTQWRDEAVRILNLPLDQIVMYHGMHRAAALEGSSAHCRLVLTTFDIVRLDCKSSTAPSPLHVAHWDRIVLDEAHRICEQSSKTARAIRSLKARNRWCVTGTPFKNGVTDLVALSKFLLVPPYCNSMWWRCHSQNRHKLQEWRNAFLNIMDKRVLSLPATREQMLKPVRTPAEEMVRKTLLDAQVAGNVSLEELEDAEMRAVVTGTLPQGEHELLRIMRLRQAANHPLLLTNSVTAMTRLLTLGVSESGCSACAAMEPVYTTQACGHSLCSTCCVDVLMCPCCIASHMHITSVGDKPWRHSAKTQVLAKYLTDTFASDPHAKVVLFSQWTTCLDLLRMLLDLLGVNSARYDGRVNSVDERADIIATFRADPECKVLLTSLGAGGEGLNLVFANHVVLMEPYWNCAAEQQAIDRLHRIGQKRTTHVVRIAVHDSIEDWVQEIQQKKTKELERLLRGAEASMSSVAKGGFRCNSGGAVVASARGGLERFLCEVEHKE